MVDPADILAAARAKDVMITVAESCTGGLLAAALTEVPGSSDVFDRGFITYSNDAKMQMLGVAQHIIADHGAVSEPCAQAMAHGARANSSAQLAVSITGIAGPGGSDHKPEGRVCFGWATDTAHGAQTVEFGAIGRAQVRAQSVAHALSILARILR